MQRTNEIINSLYKIIDTPDNNYFIVETKWTINHFEKLLPSCRDRGKWKWIAETKCTAFNNQDDDPEIQRSFIDHQDMFPRLYFTEECLVNEFLQWLDVRRLPIINVEIKSI